MPGDHGMMPPVSLPLAPVHAPAPEETSESKAASSSGFMAGAASGRAPPPRPAQSTGQPAGPTGHGLSQGRGGTAPPSRRRPLFQTAGPPLAGVRRAVFWACSAEPPVDILFR